MAHRKENGMRRPKILWSPSRVWEKTESGKWSSRRPEKSDLQQRRSVARSLRVDEHIDLGDYDFRALRAAAKRDRGDLAEAAKEIQRRRRNKKLSLVRRFLARENLTPEQADAWLADALAALDES